MKKVIVLTAIIVLSLNLQAQRSSQEPESVRSLRVAIYTQVLQLTVEEAEKFWPLFNEFNDKLREMKQEVSKKRRRLAEDRLSLSDNEIEKELDEIFDIDVEIANLQRDYMKKMMKVIPASKVVLIPRAETQFKKALLDQIKKRRKGNL